LLAFALAYCINSLIVYVACVRSEPEIDPTPKNSTVGMQYIGIDDGT